MDKKTKSHHHHPHNQENKSGIKVDQVDLSKVTTINDYIKELSGSHVFAGGHLAEAVDILSHAIQNQASIFVGMAGAMIPGGMRKVISQAMKDGFIQALTTTGANITHDIMEAIGGGHIHSVEYTDDKDLRDRGIDRVYDSFVQDGSFEGFEDFMRTALEKIMEENKSGEDKFVISTSEFIRFLGSLLDDGDSIVRTAYELDIPIYVPAISDSVLGLQIWLFAQFNQLIINPIQDLGKIQDQFHDAKLNCALLLGGGVPKNYTLQSALMATKHYKYAVQITLDRVETGGLSGATLSEAISWGKLEPDARTINVTSDLTIALPLIFAALRERFVEET